MRKNSGNGLTVTILILDMDRENHGRTQAVEILVNINMYVCKADFLDQYVRFVRCAFTTSEPTEIKIDGNVQYDLMKVFICVVGPVTPKSWNFKVDCFCFNENNTNIYIYI